MSEPHSPFGHDEPEDLVDFTKLNSAIADGIAKDAAEVEARYDDTIHLDGDYILRMAVLGRLAEPLRFSMEMCKMDNVVSPENMIAELHRAERLAPDEAVDAEDVTAMNRVPYAFEESPALLRRLNNIEASVREVFTSWHQYLERKFAEEEKEVGEKEAASRRDKRLAVTFRDLLDYQFTSFPETDELDRMKLRELAKTRMVISKRDVCVTVGVAEDSQLVDFIFGSGANVLPTKVFEEIIASLGVHPRTLNFAPQFAHKMVGGSRRGAPLLLNLVSLILIIVLAPRMANVAQHIFHTGMVDFIGNDWTNGCPNGPTSELGCYFLRRNFGTITHSEFDALRFAREEFFLRLWPTQGRASEQTFASAWLLGSLTLRHVPVDDWSGEYQRKATCQANNASTKAYVFAIAESFGCDSLWSETFSFNLTQAEVLAKAARTVNISTQLPQTTALIFDFVGYQRANGLLMSVRVTVAFPQGGSARPHIDVTAIDPTVANKALPLLIIQCISWAVVCVTAVLSQYHGVSGLTTDFAISTINFTLILVAYIYLKESKPFLEHDDVEEDFGGSLYQLSHMPPNVDVVAAHFNTGMSVLGFYVLSFVCSLGRFFQGIQGMDLVVSVLKKAYVELLSLAGIFVIWTIGFACIAMCLFGSTLTSFATFVNALFTLLDYFQGTTNYQDMTLHHPILGPMFFFVFQMFVVLFALNLLIAVLTAPLDEVKKGVYLTNQLLKDIYEELVIKKPDTSETDALRWKLYSNVWLPICSLIWDGRPVGRGHWFTCRSVLWTLYPRDGLVDIEAITREACVLLRTFGDVNKSIEEWNSPLLRHVIRNKLIEGEVSLVMCIGMIASESKFTSLRDSRLLAATTQFTKYSNRIQELTGLQDCLRDCADRETAVLDQRLHLALECADEQLKKMDESEIKALAARYDHNPTMSTNQYSPKMATGRAPPTALGGVPGSPRPLGHKKSFLRLKSVEYTRYNFGDRLSSKLNKSPFTILYAVFITIFAIAYAYPFLVTRTPTAFLTESLDNGLRDMWQTPRCTDAQCFNAWSPWGKRLGDNIMLQDWRDWMGTVLEPALFIRDRLGIVDSTAPGPGAVWWDARVKRISPLYIRQLRGVHRPCSNLPITARDRTHLDRVQQVNADPCFTGIKEEQWATTPISYPPSGALPTRLPPSAYTHSTFCHSRPDTYLGFWGNYPCGGYTVAVNDSATLMEAIDPSIRWVDNSTRFISVSADFQLGNSVVRYSIMFELGDRGQASRTHALPTPISPIHILEATEPQRIIFQVLIALHLFGFCLLRLRYYLAPYVYKDLHPQDRAEMKPYFPKATVLVGVFTFVVAYSAWTEHAQKMAITVAAIIYIENIATTNVIFPMASLVSKQVRILTATLSQAAYHCLYVFPFLITFYLAFTYSGMIVFGRGVQNFAHERVAFTSVILGTFGFDDDVFSESTLGAFRPVEAQVFAILFLCVMLIVIANMFLAMVTSASSDAKQTPEAVTIAENVQYYYNRRPVYGSWVDAFLALNIQLAKIESLPSLRKRLPKWLRRKRTRDPAILSRLGRLWFPCECLVPVLKPMRVNFLLERFSYDRLNVYAYGSLVPYIVQYFADYREEEEIAHAADEEENTKFVGKFVKRIAAAHLIRQAQIRVAQQNHPENGGLTSSDPTAFDPDLPADCIAPDSVGISLAKAGENAEQAGTNGDDDDDDESSDSDVFEGKEF